MTKAYINQMFRLESKLKFECLCKALKIPFSIANKISDARYKFGKRLFLSALDDKYYAGDNAWDAKANALQSAIKRYGKELTVFKLQYK